MVTVDPGKDLRKRTKSFALRIVRMFSALPKTTEAQILGKQVLRSGTSVGANYREAFRARSKPEFISKCGDCLKEVEEWSDRGERHRRHSREGSGVRFGRRANQTAYWLELLVDAEFVISRKVSSFVAGMRRADGDLRFDHQEFEAQFLILNS